MGRCGLAGVSFFRYGVWIRSDCRFMSAGFVTVWSVRIFVFYLFLELDWVLVVWRVGFFCVVLLRWFLTAKSRS